MPSSAARIVSDRDGEAPGVIVHPEVGPIGLVCGKPAIAGKRKTGFGLAKFSESHPEMMPVLGDVIPAMPVTGNARGRVILDDGCYRAVLSEDFEGVERRYVVTAFEKAPGNQTSHRDPLPPDGISTGAGLARTIGEGGGDDNAAGAFGCTLRPEGRELG